jgi:hypothetical protein
MSDKPRIHKKREAILYAGFDKPEGAPDFTIEEYVSLADYDKLAAELEAVKAENEKLKWLARNPTAHPSAMDYAEELERKLDRLTQANEVLRAGLEFYAGAGSPSDMYLSNYIEKMTDDGGAIAFAALTEADKITRGEM